MVPVINLAKTGQNIKKIRIEKGLTVHDIQMIMGFVNPQAIYKWQDGTSLPSVDNLVILSQLFGVPIEDILVIE